MFVVVRAYKDSQGGTLIRDVQKIVKCKDGRHLVSHPTKCKCCGQDTEMVTQVPKDYYISIEMEARDEILVEHSL